MQHMVSLVQLGVLRSVHAGANIVYFSSTCFGPIHPSSGAIEFIISFTNAAYGVLVQLGVSLEESARWWCVAMQCNTPPARTLLKTGT